MSKSTVVYIPHGGGPMPLLDEAGNLELNNFLRGFSTGIQKPDAIVVISAHWEDAVIAVTASASPPMLFDYFGFPDEAYQYQYPASGNPELAARIDVLLKQAGIESHLEHERGFDHGLFIPLMMMYPEADIPCIQISLSNSLDAEVHLAVGEALRDLRAENILFVGSGFSFHNTQAFIGKSQNGVDPKNQEFECWLKKTCSSDELTEEQRRSELCDWQSAPHAYYCHPREEHLLPLHVCYGIAGSKAETIFEGRVTGFMVSAYQW